jgi:sugar lactone lactonase YvrE/enterochelin esterase-like enzyme
MSAPFRRLAAAAFLAVLPVLTFAQPAAPAPGAPLKGSNPPQTPPADLPLIQKMQAEMEAGPSPDQKQHPGTPHGETLMGVITDSKIYPGTENPFKVYVPAQYDPAKPACLLVHLDGLPGTDPWMLDNLIASHEIPVMIEVGVTPGMIRNPTKQNEIYRFNRSYEFDSMNDNFANYVLDELLPAVEKMTTKDGKPVRLSRDPSDRMVTGGSTGGIGSFNLAWRRPDSFGRVYSIIGTFVSMRGGHEFPALIRKTDPKPIRVFLEDGSSDAWNPLFGSWFENNQEMESALNFAGYDVGYVWGNHAHNGKVGNAIFPDVMRWLWRDYPKPIAHGTSLNDKLSEILVPGEDWKQVADGYQGAAGLASNTQGEVCFCDAPAHTIYKIGADGAPKAWMQNAPPLAGEAFGPDGTLYGADRDNGKIVSLAADGTGAPKTIADGIKARGIVVTADNQIYATEPGVHDDEPSKLWLVKPTGEETLLDSGLLAASGVVLSPDRFLLYAAEESTKWVFSYLTQPDGTLTDKERFFWLHITDIDNNSGAQDMAVDQLGTLYVATRMGIQVCDRNGRVRAILPLPTPCGPIQSLCFGGPAFDTLFATDGVKVFQRKMKVPGYSQWAAPLPYVKASGG